MKNLVKFLLILIICVQFNCDLTTSQDGDSTTTEPIPEPVYEADLTRLWFVIDGIEYDSYLDSSTELKVTRNRGEMGIWIPYNYPFSNLIAYFAVSEGAKVFVNDVEQVSGVTANDFINPVAYKIVSKDGKKEYLVTVAVTWLRNRESKLYWLKVTAGGTPYNCEIDQDSKTATLSVPTGTDLSPVTLEFKVSDNANLLHQSSAVLNGGYANFDSTDNIIKIKAENTMYYTDYTLVKEFTK